MRNLPVFLLCLVCVVVYGLVVPRLFKRGEKSRPTLVKRLFIYLFWGVIFSALWHSYFYPSAPACQMAGIALGLGSLALFRWAYRQHGRHMPGRAFTPDVPAAIVTSGPYARVRHPIYAAYLLFMLGLVVGTQSALAAVLWLLLGVMYHHAASQEDALLAASAHADLYRRYMQQSGRLLPWNVWRRRQV